MHQDAHEFLNFLLNDIAEHLEKTRGIFSLGCFLFSQEKRIALLCTSCFRVFYATKHVA